jgi:Tol biopolymer transport system component
LVLTLVTHAVVASQIDPEDLLQSGLYKEQVEGDLEGAIEIFEQVIAEYSQNRPVAAQALLHLGSSYEKLGNLKAEDAYQRLIEEFGDQHSMVSEARMRLQKMRFRELTEGMQKTGAGPSYRIAIDDMPKNLAMWNQHYNFSPDGEQIVYRSKGGLYVSDASGTLRRLLVADNESQEEWSENYVKPVEPRWSPDGKQIAFLASKPKSPGDDSEDQISAAFLIDAEGGEARQLTGELDPCPYRGFWWAPDGKGLIYLSREGVYLIDLQGKIKATIDINIDARSTRLAGYSPDGRWLTIWKKEDEASGNNWNTDIYLVPAAGGDAVQLTFAQGFDAHPVWSADSRSVYFISQRAVEWGNSNIWKVSVDQQTGQPIGDPEQVTFFDDAQILHPQMVGSGNRLSFYMQNTKHSVRVAPADQPENYRTLARGIGPSLSPDGKTVYYVGEGPDQQGIYAVSAEGGSSKRYTTEAPTSGHKSVSPDGKTLAYFSDSDNRRGLFTLSVKGGQPRLLLESDCAECCKSVHWSPDGKSLTYNSDDGLYLISSTGGEPKKLATLKGWESWTISWSPNGEYVAALGYQEGKENNAVFIVPVEGGKARLLSGFDDYKEGLSWHPDGKSLTYHLSKGASQTYRCFLDGRPPELFLDKADAWDYVGIWSPDGNRYYLSNSATDSWQTDIYDVNTGEFTPFVNAALPRWSGDQKTMVWTAEKRIIQLWLMEDFK